MGLIAISVEGSFKKRGLKRFSAMKHGHAQAVADAIEYLSAELLPSAIYQDHELQEAGCVPEEEFGKNV